MSTTKKYDLIKWDTPFAKVSFPSVYIIGDEKEDERNLIVAVAPDGVDNYPKFIIRFENVLAFKAEEEAQWTENSDEKLSLDPDSNSSFIRPNDSFWWKAYGNQMRDFNNTEPMHFYLFGGDYLVQVFASDNPTIEKVEESKTIILKHVV
ncbi:MAG: hypothetical protein ABJH08_04325 [Balneola sp.]